MQVKPLLAITSCLMLFGILPAAGAVPPCVRDIEINFFRQNLVDEALSLHSVSQSNWVLIRYELSRRVKEVPTLVEKMAKQMSPNPLKEPYNLLAVGDLVEQALLEVFKDTLVIFHIQNADKITEMFRYIKSRQKERWIACFGDKENRKESVK